MVSFLTIVPFYILQVCRSSVKFQDVNKSMKLITRHVIVTFEMYEEKLPAELLECNLLKITINYRGRYEWRKGQTDGAFAWNCTVLRSRFIVRAVGSRVTIHPVHHKLVTIPGLRPCLFTRYARKLSNEETIGYKFIPSGEFARLSIPRALSSYHRVAQ